MQSRDSISIITTGSEILDGRVVDTNSNHLAQTIDTLGLKVRSIISCDDDLDEIVSALELASLNSRVVIISGGLGPTSDDLTREAVAAFCGVKLKENNQAKAHVENYFSSRNRPCHPSNLKQALLPEGATMLNNKLGTAPGFLCKRSEAVILALSGVPKEQRDMVSESVVPFLEKLFSNRAKIERTTLKLFGLPESFVGSTVKAAVEKSDVIVSYRAAFPEVHVSFKCSNDSKSLIESTNKAREAIQEQFIFSSDSNESFEKVIHDLLISYSLSVSTAESCTSGMLATKLTNIAGSSKYFYGGVNCYSDEVKHEILGVQKTTLQKFGAVSKETALELATNVKTKLGTKIGISITGIAGPDGGTDEKPVGTFWVGLSWESEEPTAYHFHFPGDRAAIRTYATYVAMDSIRRKIKGYKLGIKLPYVAEPIQQPS